MYQTSFSPGSVDLRELQTMAKWLKTKTGKDVRVEQVIMVTTDSAEVSNMMDSLLAAVKVGKNGKIISAVRRGRKPNAVIQNAQGEKTAIGGSSRRIIETGEIISLVELKRRIGEGEVMDTTIVENKRGERFVVMGGELIKEPQS